MIRLLAIVLCVCAVGSQAEILKWVDEKGRVHYGDKVPEKYKEKSETVETETNVVDNDNRDKNKKAFKKIERQNADRSSSAQQNSAYRPPSNTPKPTTKQVNRWDCSSMPSKAAEINCKKRKGQF